DEARDVDDATLAETGLHLGVRRVTDFAVTKQFLAKREDRRFVGGHRVGYAVMCDRVGNRLGEARVQRDRIVRVTLVRLRPAAGDQQNRQLAHWTREFALEAQIVANP